MNLFKYIKKCFTYHPPNEDQTRRFIMLREKARDFAETVAAACPECRERVRAIDHIDEAVMSANAAIARWDVVGDQSVPETDVNIPNPV